uniref:Uncharacterized protein n=1 Tax=Chromera velia CCMP2878 TaxID=1169474 RepID=A0A0G4HZM4_9ALVE|eukprot:Cvel_9735.t1-p1 / transcript=Cvel_9735.t1 / gene=Cvel_9735 / organism=Chromera_velia_CCMP2878 / gene_product=hypothetical protein / transcript_product=hypothetical protein / location=Cvel_scaffold569:17778-20885(+) / protein_length=1036 / sequence_SO=supercontig / SO=protein_coding / is_pseudo=false
MAAKDSDILSVLIASGILGLRKFCLLSSVSKKLLALRDDLSPLGFGSVCPGFSDPSERGEVCRFLANAFERDDAKALQQILALKGMAGRYPFLLRQALQEHPSSDKCIEFLMLRGVTPYCADLSDQAIGTLTAARVTQMIRLKVLSPDSFCEGSRREKMRPLLNRLIENSQFQEAEALVVAGARADICNWQWCSRSNVIFLSDESIHTPLHLLVEALASNADNERRRQVAAAVSAGDIESDPDEPSAEEKGRQYIEQRKQGLSLLGLLARASKQAGCLDWRKKGSFYSTPDLMARLLPECTALGMACYFGDVEAVKVLSEVTDRVEVGGVQLPFLVLGARCQRLIHRPDGYSEEIDARCAEILEVLAELEGVDLNAVKKAGGERGHGSSSVPLADSTGPEYQPDRHTPLSLACSLGMAKSAEALLRKGAVPRRVRASASPLHEALFYDRNNDSETLTSLLLRWKADPNETVVTFGSAYTLLQKILSPFFEDSVRFGNPYSKTTAKLAKQLIRNGARCPLSSPPPQTVTETGGTPGLCTQSLVVPACSTKDAELVSLLCSIGGADPNGRGKAESAENAPAVYPVTHAVNVTEGGEEAAGLLEALASAGANLDVTEEDGHGLLSLTCRWGGDPSTVDFLLKRGLSVGGGRGAVAGGLRRIPLLEAAAWPLTEIVDMLLEAGADPNETGTLRGGDGKERLTCPLQAVMDQEEPGPGMVRAVFGVVESLIRHGACCPEISPAETESQPQPSGGQGEGGTGSGGRGGLQRNRGTGEGTERERSDVSPLYKACLFGDAPLVEVLRQRGQARPRGGGEVAGVLAVLLTDRANESQSEGGVGSQRVVEQWRLAEKFVSEEVVTFSSQSGLPGVVGFLSLLWRGKWNSCASPWAPRFGSGSWLADLIALEEARGPVLLDIIRALPQQEVEESLIRMDIGQTPHCLCGSELNLRNGDFSPLVVAIKAKWDDGVNVLMEMGVGMNRRNTDPQGILCSPVFAALDTKQWELAGRLIEKGGRVTSVEETGVRTGTLEFLPAELRAKVLP